MNFDYEIEKINPINISDEEFNVYKIPNNVRKSIALYNKSVINFKISCVDLAIADLKKSLSLNPDFSEAIKLLGLCYVYKKDFDKAEKLFKKLAKYDIYTVQANKYLKEMETDKTVSKALDTIKSASSTSANDMKRDSVAKLPAYRDKIKKIKNLPKKFIVSFLAATITIAIAGVAYCNRSNIQSMFNKSQKVELEKSKELVQQKAVSEKNKEMDEKQKRLQKNIEAAKAELDNYKNKDNTISVLNDAEKFYSEGNYERSLDNLITLKSLKLDDAEKSRFDKLWNSIKANDVWTIYNQGNKLYKQGNYQEALPKLLKVQQVAPELEVMPWNLYQIGNCYKQTNDTKNAILYFEKVKNDYPNTEYARYSEGMINEINSKK
ncbi:tetratricopeptide repeat protein [Clostridium aciditolerans]|uniref:Tetratricopeptide repeat protein n=1 Tax=Clostridium aciditolerans TaxID=339861 RepID=A0A934I0G1_9CLOT|nr:tetratricopeptide repeat protein [Clostridium aciditolerans]